MADSDSVDDSKVEVWQQHDHIHTFHFSTFENRIQKEGNNITF